MTWKRRLVYSLFEMNYVVRRELFEEWECPRVDEIFETCDSQIECLLRWCQLQGQIHHLAARVVEIMEREG